MQVGDIVKHIPSEEEIVKWSNEEAERTDAEKRYTATGSRIAIHERCEGARWAIRMMKEENQLNLFK